MISVLFHKPFFQAQRLGRTSSQVEKFGLAGKRCWQKKAKKKAMNSKKCVSGLKIQPGSPFGAFCPCSPICTENTSSSSYHFGGSRTRKSVMRESMVGKTLLKGLAVCKPLIERWATTCSWVRIFGMSKNDLCRGWQLWPEIRCRDDEQARLGRLQGTGGLIHCPGTRRACNLKMAENGRWVDHNNNKKT